MPYDLFISYAHKDNSRSQVRELRDEIASEFRRFAGRDLQIFFDEDEIPTMADWESRISQGLRESRQFLAVLSPSYFASDYCRREWEEYLRYEAMRQCLGDGVAPIYFVELPEFEKQTSEVLTAWKQELRKRQWCQLLPWHDVGRKALEQEHVRDRLTVLNREILERLDRADRAALSPSNLYRHNPQFVGRIAELTELRSALNERGNVGYIGHASGAMAVHGLGGMGKTELALAYAHAFAWDYPGGRWLIRCEGLRDIDEALHRLLDPLKINVSLDERTDITRCDEKVIDELRNRERTLLLFDNVTEASLLAPHSLMRLPPPGQVHCLATTRLGPSTFGGSSQDHAFVSVDSLPLDDAVALFRSHQPGAKFRNSQEEASATELVRLLEGFTLAIETAAIFLGRNREEGAIAKYLAALKSDLLVTSESLAADPAVAVRHRERLLERTLTTTLDSLDANGRAVLLVAAHLPPDLIPRPWLASVANELGNSATAANSETIDALVDLRLLLHENGQYLLRMHRLVGELVRKRSSPNEQKLVQEHLVRHARTRCRELHDTWIAPGSRWEVAPIIEFAKRALDEQIIDAEYVAHEIGVVAMDLGDTSAARRLLDQADARVLSEGLLGELSVNHASSQNNIAKLMEEEGRWDEAFEMRRNVLSLYRLNLGDEHPHVATAFFNLGKNYLRRGKFDKAREHFDRAVSIDETVYGPNHPETATDLSGIADLLSGSGKVDEAMPIYRRALEIYLQALPADHPNTAIARSNLADALFDLNQLDEAEQMLRHAVASLRRTFPGPHPETAKRLMGLAKVLLALNRRPDGVRAAQEALEMLVEHSVQTGVPNRLAMTAAKTLVDVAAETEQQRPFWSAIGNKMLKPLQDLGSSQKAAENPPPTVAYNTPRMPPSAFPTSVPSPPISNPHQPLWQRVVNLIKRIFTRSSGS